MAGVPGMKGGGGARPGAGRKPGPKPEPAVNPGIEPLAFLEGVMQGLIEATPLQIRAAIAAAQYRHVKLADGGKKDQIQEKAEKVAQGRFVAAAPPLKVVGR